MKTLSIVERIMKSLKIGEEGKIASFFEKQVKEMNRAIDAHKRNLSNLAFQNEKELEAKREELEDAQAETDAAYENVKPSDVESNGAQADFAKKYWSRVEQAEGKAQSIQNQIDYAVEQYNKEVESVTEQIDELNFRIEKLK